MKQAFNSKAMNGDQILNIIQPAYFSTFAQSLQNGKQQRNLKKLRMQSFMFTIISLLGLCLLVVFTFYSKMPPSQQQKPWIGLSFITVCVLGILAGVFPSRCSSMLHHSKSVNRNPTVKQKADNGETVVAIKGHHPDCGSFNAHTFQLRDKIYCAGCMGLVTGATFAILGSLAYFFFGLNIQGLGVLVFWFGFFGVFLGLFQYVKFFVTRAFIHFILNVVFVLGTFLLLLGVAEVNGSISLESYFLGLALYWILIRILLSQWEHKKTCASCVSKHCSFFSRE